jgi:hypothetical protein
VSTRRVLLVAGGIAVAASAAVVIVVRTSLDRLVEAAIERHGSEVAQTAVRAQGVSIDVAAGRGTVRGVTVANPPDFSDATAIALAEISLELDLRSLGARPIVLDELHIGEPRVLFELAADGRANLDALRESIDAYPRRARSGAVPPAGEADGARLRVRRLAIDDGALRIDPSAVGREPLDLPLGAIELRDVGGARGATPGELGRAVADAVVARALRAVAGAEARRALRDLGGENGDKLGALQKGLDR